MPEPEPVPEPVPEPGPQPEPRVAAAGEAGEPGATAPAGGALDLATVRASWGGIVGNVRRKSVASFLAYGTAASLDGDELTVAFPWAYHADRCGEPDNAELIADAVERQLGQRVRLRCVVDAAADPGEPTPLTGGAGDEATTVAETEADEAAGARSDPDAVHDQAIDTITRGLGATVVSDERD